MAEKQPPRTRIFGGDRMTWISPVTLKELLEAKVKYPQAPVIMGNTSTGMQNPRDFLWGNLGKVLWGKEPPICLRKVSQIQTASSALLKRLSQLPYASGFLASQVGGPPRVACGGPASEQIRSSSRGHSPLSLQRWRGSDLKWLCFLSQWCLSRWTQQLQGLSAVSIANLVWQHASVRTLLQSSQRALFFAEDHVCAGAAQCLGFISLVWRLTVQRVPHCGKNLSGYSLCDLAMNKPVERYVFFVYLKTSVLITISN